MQICEKQYQSLNISASPSFVSAQGRENERRGWTEETYDAKNKEPGNRYDWSRRHLNFEIKRSRKIGKINGETVYARPIIIPLGTQEKSLKERYDERLKELKFRPWSPDAPNQPNTCIDFVLNGDHDRMTEIAFGKPMDFDWREDNSSVTLADDPDHSGRKQIETLALDYYDFLCRKFGEENVLGLECHLDETTPHFHALVVPVAKRKPQGKTGGYDLDPDVEPDGKERPTHIIKRQFERLSEDEKRFYKPAVKKMVPMVSYAHYFGKTKFQAYTSYKQWHTMLYEEVNSKWVQTILRSFASVHKDELTRRSRAIVKQELRQNAIAIRKIRQYDEMTKRGITIDSYERAKEKAANYDNISNVLETIWPGLWNAVQVIINPRLDRYVMNDREKETVRKAISDDPKTRLANAGWILSAVDTIRNIAVGTKSEVYQIGAESAVRFLVDTGLNLAEGIAENVAEVAATTASLFFGYVDAATTISQSCGGGGCNNELPRRKDKEDYLAFARRCHQAAKTMIQGSHKRGLHL